MQWLADNFEVVLAIIGGLFVVLRIVVALTPTPKDDQLIKKASTIYEKIVGHLARVAGLDTTQGVAKDPNAKKSVTMFLMVCIMSCVVGCSSFQTAVKNERARLVLIQKSFASTVRTLTVLNKANQFSEKEQDRITIVIHNVNSHLKEWEDSVKLELKRPDLLQLIIPLMVELNGYARRDSVVVENIE